MLRFYAVAYVGICQDLIYMESVFRFKEIGQKSSAATFTDEEKRKYVNSLESMREHLERTGLRQSIKKLARMIEEVNGDLRYVGAQQAVDELGERIKDELEDGYFLHLTPDEAARLEAQEPMGPEVTAKLGAAEDCAEASKCLGVGRWTASVFHLMRLMELAVQKWGDKLGVILLDSRGRQKNWQNLLDEANKAIRALNPSLSITKQHAEIAALLYTVKIAWRNEVMHPKATYTEEEATDLFRAVKSFSSAVCGVL